MSKHSETKRGREIRLQQLRCFCETAKHGSQTAAAKALGLTQPTVGEQVHALEREFETKLIEPHGRGCRLTEAGETLADLAGRLVAGIDSLKTSFHDAQQTRLARLTVASSPRIFIEDMPECLVEFEQTLPDVRITCMELRVEDVVEAVKSGNADLGLTLAPLIESDNAWITTEPGYDLDLLVTMKEDHPLAQRPRIELADLAEFPVVNAANSIPDPAVRAQLVAAGVFDKEPRRVEATYTAAVRRFVKLGFGLGLVYGIADTENIQGLHARSISPLVGRTRVDFVWRKGAFQQQAARTFAAMLVESMQRRREVAAQRG